MQTALPPELTKRLAAYPNVLDALSQDFDKDSLPPDYIPKTIEIMFDELPVYCWDDGREVLHLEVPADPAPQVMEWAFDGELVYVALEGQPILNRLQNVANLHQLRNSYAS